MEAYQVQGRHASSNEYYVALALERLRLPFIFQFAPFGFTGQRGQYVVDFLVQDPFNLPVEVFGEYWHTGQLGMDDKLRLAVLGNYFHREVLVLWGVDTDTEEEALKTVRKEIGVSL